MRRLGVRIIGSANNFDSEFRCKQDKVVAALPDRHEERRQLNKNGKRLFLPQRLPVRLEKRKNVEKGKLFRFLQPRPTPTVNERPSSFSLASEFLDMLLRSNSTRRVIALEVKHRDG